MLGRLDPLSSRVPLGRTRPELDDIVGHNHLISSAKKKFEMGFLTSFSEGGGSGGATTRATSLGHIAIDAANAGRSMVGIDRPHLPPRSSSVLGIHPSSERQVDGTLKQSGMDYVDLECMLQEKMRELNVSRSAVGDPPLGAKPKKSKSKGPSSSSSSESEASAREKENSEHAGGEVAAEEYAKRCHEAGYLFKLCKQEVMLQVNINCPERARLADRTLEFYTSVLDCLLSPLEKCRMSLAEVRRARAGEEEAGRRMRGMVQAWLKDRGASLEGPAWARAGGKWSGGPRMGGDEGLEEWFEVVMGWLAHCAECSQLLQGDKVKLENEAKALKGELERSRDGAEREGDEARRYREEAEEGLRSLGEARELLQARVGALEVDVGGLHARCEELQKDAGRLREELERSEVVRKSAQAKVAEQASEIELLKARLAEFTVEGVVLTPRPAWREGEGGGGRTGERAEGLREQLEAERGRVAELEGVVAQESKGREEERQRSQTAEEACRRLEAARATLEGEVRALQDRPSHTVGVGCPEELQCEEVEVGEYLQMYLCKRFGLKGEMSSWEVERMGKDFGWVMEAKVANRSGGD